MTKLQLLHRALNERLMAAVEQIMEMVGGTVLEYEEETIRARKENEVLRRRLRWMEGANRADWPGSSTDRQLGSFNAKYFAGHITRLDNSREGSFHETFIWLLLDT